MAWEGSHPLSLLRSAKHLAAASYFHIKNIVKKKRKKKSTPVKVLEYAIVYMIILVAGAVPLRVMNIAGSMLGDMLFFISSKRRNIAIDNLSKAFGSDKNDKEIKKIARESCGAFFLTFLEIIKFRHLFSSPDRMNTLRQKTKHVDELFKKAREIHDQSGGCIFVTPHIGNWEVLPHVSSFVGIPLAIVARPLDNEYLEKLVYADRTSSGQILIPKKNALFTLQKTLRSGTSLGILPDQSTMKGIVIDFFGRPATTTPVPAILAINYRRPIVVVACCRNKDDDQYGGFVSDPIWPGEYESEKAEIFRITQEMNRQMEKIIRRYPEQYLWMHNRWKTYKGKKAVLSDRK